MSDEQFQEEAILLLDKLSEQYGAEPFSQKDATRDHAETIGQTTVQDHLGYLVEQGHVRKFGGHTRMYEIVADASVEDRLEDDDPVDLCEIYRG